MEKSTCTCCIYIYVYIEPMHACRGSAEFWLQGPSCTSAMVVRRRPRLTPRALLLRAARSPRQRRLPWHRPARRPAAATQAAEDASPASQPAAGPSQSQPAAASTNAPVEPEFAGDGEDSPHWLPDPSQATTEPWEADSAAAFQVESFEDLELCMDDDMDDVPGAAAPPAAADAPPAADAPHLYWAVAPPEWYKVREVYWSRAVARFGWFQQQLAEACQWEHVDIGMADELERAMGGCQALVVYGDALLRGFAPAVVPRKNLMAFASRCRHLVHGSKQAMRLHAWNRLER